MKLPMILALLIAVPFPALAQPVPGTHARLTDSRLTQSRIDARQDERRAREWGLRTDEWARYRELMQGPLGMYSPQLDPLSVLGVEARDDDERIRYAELQVQFEARRVERLLAYQRAYDEAWQRLQPGLPRVNMPEGPPDHGDSTNTARDRTAVFVRDDCAPCEQTVQRLQATGGAFDIYVVGSRGEDARIRAWARRSRIDPARVLARTITLNHDGGRWRSLGLSGELPAVVRQVGGQWQRQP